jgi:hypothetical protein
MLENMSKKDGTDILFFELITRLLATNISIIHNQSKITGSKEIIEQNESLLVSLRNWIKRVKGNEDLSLDVRNIVSLVDNVLSQNIKDLNTNDILESEIESNQSMDSSASIANESHDLPANDSVKHESDPINLSLGDPDIIPSKTSKTLELLDKITEIGKVEKQPIGPPQLFQRMLQPNDQWSYLETTATVLRNYSHIMHLALPNYCFAIIEDLHRYTSQDFELLNTIISTPYYALLELIQKFLREAPSATILRRFRSVRRMAQIDIEEDTSVNISEKNEVKLIVDNYFSTLKNFFDLEETPSLQSYYSKIKEQYSRFSLGPSQVESRIIIVIKNLIDNLIKKLDQEVNELTLDEKVAILGSIDILMNLTDYWLTEGRIRSLLEAMKD